MKSRRKIGVDLDDTLVDFTGAFILYHNEIYKTNLRREQFTSLSFNRVLGVTPKEANKRVNDFYGTEYFRKIQPILGSVEAVKTLAQEDDLYIITSRPEFLRKETSQLQEQYFQTIFLEIFYSYNHYAKHGDIGKSKPEICLRLGISKLIDDSLEYAKQCAERGIEVILFGDNNFWNQDRQLPPNVLRAKNWKEALEKLK